MHPSDARDGRGNGPWRQLESDAAIHETPRPGGIWEETREVVPEFARDVDTTRKIPLREQMEAVRRAFLEGEHDSASEAL